MIAKMNCDWPKSYLHITQALMDDQSKFATRKRTIEIVNILQDQLDINKTRTMTFTEDGLGLAIRLIKDNYGIED